MRVDTDFLNLPKQLSTTIYIYNIKHYIYSINMYKSRNPWKYTSTMALHGNMSALPCGAMRCDAMFSWDGHQELANPIENLVDV